MEELTIHFERADKGLGLSIAGGYESTPYKDQDEGIFISRVTAGGPADIAGLRKDDKVLVSSFWLSIREFPERTKVQHKSREMIAKIKTPGLEITLFFTF